MPQWLSEFVHSPVGTVIVSAIGIIFETLVIFSRTSFGKKALEKLGNRVGASEFDVNKALKTIEETEKNCNNKVQELEDFYNKKLEEKDKEIERLENLVLTGFGAINNVKVKKATKDYEKNNCDKIVEENEKAVDNGENE